LLTISLNISPFLVEGVAEFNFDIYMKVKKNPEMDEMFPLKFYLSQNYPNPFKDKTTIKYCVAYKARVRLTVFNSEREKVDTLIDEIKDPGTYEVEFQSFEGNDKLIGGCLYYRLAAGNYTSEKKMERMK
jgi:hypothetical protein